MLISNYITPVMLTDSTGYLSESIKDGLIALGVAVVVVAVIAIVTMVSGGLATPVLVGAVIGAFSGGAISAGMQYATTGSVEVGQVMLNASIGAIMGGFSGSGLSQLGMTIAGSLTGTGSSIVSDVISGSSIHLGRAIFAGVTSGFFAYMGGAGGQYGKISQRANIIDKMNALPTRFLGRENSNAYKQSFLALSNRLNKLTTQSYQSGMNGVYYGIYPAILNSIIND